MQSDKEKLLAWVEQSRTVLNDLEPDSNEAKSLGRIIQQIEEGLADDGIPDETDLGIVDLSHLKETLTELEVTHPRVTGIMNDLMVALSSMGI